MTRAWKNEESYIVMTS